MNPYSVVYIERYTFSNCFSLNTISIPPFISDFDKDAFVGCITLVQIVSLPHPRPKSFRIVDSSEQIEKCPMFKQYIIPSLDDGIYSFEINNFKITNRLGGSAAHVYIVLDSKQHEFVLKEYPIDIFWMWVAFILIVEISSLPFSGLAKTLKYRLLVSRQETNDNFSGYILITEYCKNGDISKITSNYLSSKGAKNDKMNPTIRCKIIFGAAATMKRLHKKNIIHRNLSHANILLDEKLEPRIGSFSVAKYITSTTEMAPEVIMHENRTYGLHDDAYSY